MRIINNCKPNEMWRPWILASLFLISPLAGMQARAARSEAIVPPFAKAPTVDGIMAPGEWDGAFKTIGFQSISPPDKPSQSPLLDSRKGKAWFGYTEDRLYIAVATELPPDGKLITTPLAREGQFQNNDAIEIWLDPNLDFRNHADGARDLYQFVINSSGDTLNRRLLPGANIIKEGAPLSIIDSVDAEWQGTWKFVQITDAEAGLWVFEASLPWSDLGWKPEDVFVRSIGILIARNYQQPAAQKTWFPHRGSFSSWHEYPSLKLRKSVPYIRIEELGDALFDGHLQLKSRIINPGNAGKVTVWTKASGSGSSPYRERKDIELPAKGEASYNLDMGPDQLGGKGPYEVKLMVIGGDGNVILLNWSLCWDID